ncbi:MAG: hypothetical protein HYY60_00790 [Parcubacteria group bacterium]|nr:hypothetical protein [Parcubacteria group bacterium]
MIELMVTVSIIVIISSIVLFNFPSFASRILLENLTHEIALVVRQAQVYGIGIKQTTGGLFPAYGAHFSNSSGVITVGGITEEARKLVIFFADLPAGTGNGQYDGGEEVETFTIQRGNTVSDLCYTNAIHTTWQCDVNNLDVIFKRPEPEAHIKTNPDIGELDSARITVTLPSAEIGERYITVYSSGQIAVTAE